MVRPAFSWGEPTRLAGLRPLPARAVLLVLLLLVAFGLASPSAEPTGQPGAGDATLYRRVAARVAAGEPYHQAAAAEQRGGHYPLRPFTAMRQPLLAEIGGALGPAGADLLLRLLGIAAAGMTALRLLRALPPPVRFVAAALAAGSIGLLATPGMWVWHELWAGLLVALALACRTPRHWHIAVPAGLAAALIRELAFPLLPLMAVAALMQGRRREASGWTIAALIALAALARHAVLAAQVAHASDAVSPGWLVFGGWRFDLVLARHGVLLLALPAWITAIALPLALLGWIGWRSDYAARVTAMLVFWLGAFLFVGRPDNDYWGFLLAPLLPVGLALAPAALRDLVAIAMPGLFRSAPRGNRLSGLTKRDAEWPFNPIAGFANRR